MSFKERNGSQVPHHSLEVMILRDIILNFKPMKGETIHHLWLRFKIELE